MHELHLTNNNIFYTLIVSTNRYLDHFRLLEEKMWGENWVFDNGRLKESPHERIKSSQHLVFHYVCDAFFRCLIDSLALISLRIKGRRALEDQGVSISKIKRRDQIRSRIKRYKIIAIGTGNIGKLSIFYKQYIKIRELCPLTWLRPREGKGIKNIYPWGGGGVLSALTLFSP